MDNNSVEFFPSIFFERVITKGLLPLIDYVPFTSYYVRVLSSDYISFTSYIRKKYVNILPKFDVDSLSPHLRKGNCKKDNYIY